MEEFEDYDDLKRFTIEKICEKYKDNEFEYLIDVEKLYSDIDITYFMRDMEILFMYVTTDVVGNPKIPEETRIKVSAYSVMNSIKNVKKNTTPHNKLGNVYKVYYGNENNFNYFPIKNSVYINLIHIKRDYKISKILA